MNHIMIDIRKKVRYVLALLLFLGVLIGGSAAALSILAAGISAISSPKYTAVSSVEPSTNPSPSPKTQVVIPNSSQPATKSDNVAPNGSTTTGVATEDFSQRLNDQIDHMHSPIGDAIDNGGVSLGNRVQTIFGNVLSGILKSLFLEQPDTNSTNAVQNAAGGSAHE